MEQISLIHEDIYEALRTCIQAIGGAKKVGVELWPELSADKAGNRLNDSLNRSRREQLNAEQIIWILARARQANCHAGMSFIAEECGYKYEPIEPENEQAKLMREFIEMSRRMEQISAQMQHVTALKAVSK